MLVNPLVYMCEGFRAALDAHVAHMSLWVVYPALSPSPALFTWIGIAGFQRRVLT